MFKTSVIIPTFNRPSELEDCIRTLLKQTVKPNELIIVDDGFLSKLPLLKECKEAGILYVYWRKGDPGLTRSRNIGIKLANGDIVFFLDDDVLLFPDYIEEILSIYEKDEKGWVGGVGGVLANPKTLNLRNRLRRIFDILFFISGLSEGKVLPNGFCTNYGSTGLPIRGIKEVDFLPGGICSYRRQILREFTFNTDKYIGYGLGEDQDFSYRVSKRYKLLINPKAKLFHMDSPLMKPGKETIGKGMVLHRYFFFKNYVKRHWWNWLFFYYAIFGYLGFRVVMLILSCDWDEINRLHGIVTVLKNILKKQFLKGFIKGEVLID